MKASLKKPMLCLTILLLATNNLHAQKSMIEIEKIFTKNNWGDVWLQSDPIIKYDYYIQDNILYKKQGDFLAPDNIPLADIDFSREFTYENKYFTLTNSQKNPYDLSIYSLKPNEIQGFTLTFESEGDAKLAFKYLKMRKEKPVKEIILTEKFSAQLKEIICNLGSNPQKQIQLEGSLSASISSDGGSIHYGHFDIEESGVKAYNVLREKINALVPECGQMSSQPFGDYNPNLKSAMGLWTIRGIKSLDNKDATIQMLLMGNDLKINIMVLSDDEDDGW